MRNLLFLFLRSQWSRSFPLFITQILLLAICRVQNNLSVFLVYIGKLWSCLLFFNIYLNYFRLSWLALWYVYSFLMCFLLWRRWFLFCLLFLLWDDFHVFELILSFVDLIESLLEFFDMVLHLILLIIFNLRNNWLFLALNSIHFFLVVLDHLFLLLLQSLQVFLKMLQLRLHLLPQRLYLRGG